jgi:tetratricopeptide (TPR) repeat protein
LIYRATFDTKVGVKRALVALLVVALLLPSCPPPAVAQTTEADVYVAQATLDFDDKRYNEALENLRHALQLEADHIEALYYTGLVHMARRQPEQGVPFLERARAKSPTDTSVAYQLGLAHFALQRYDRAEPLLEQVFDTNRELDGLGYYVGFLRYRKKDYRGALNAFRAGRAGDPEIQQLTRFYTGLALGILGLPTQAAAEVEQALRLAPGSPLTGPAERLRDTIVAARGRERRFSAEARFGVTYDDNVIVRPNANSHEPLAAEVRRHAHQSPGELFALRADYVWWRAESWESTVGYSFFATYNNHLPSFNVMDHMGSAGLTYKTALGAMPMQAGLQYSFDQLYLDQKPFIERHTLTLSDTLVESNLHLTQVFTRYQHKDFSGPRPRGDRRENRDADNIMVGFLHLLRFAEDRHFVKAGYQFDYEDTWGKNYAYRGHRLSAGGQYTLPWGDVRLKYDFDVHLREYVHKNSILPTPNPGSKRRQDEEITNIARVEYPIPYSAGWLCGPWGTIRDKTERCATLSGEYQSTTAHSNLALFDYSRNVFSMILSWSY